MRSRTGRWAMSVVIAAALGCGAKVKPGLGVTGAKLEAKFDRAMVGPEALGRDAQAGALRVRPEIAGKLRWLDARTLAFVPAEPLPGSTRFDLEVPAGTTALDSLGLTKPVRWSFETERLRVHFGGDNPGAWGLPDQPIGLSFNQPVRARDVERHCVYLSDTAKQEAVVDNTGESDETRRRFPRDPARAAGARHGLEVPLRRRADRSRGAPRARDVRCGQRWSGACRQRAGVPNLRTVHGHAGQPARRRDSRPTRHQSWSPSRTPSGRSRARRRSRSSPPSRDSPSGRPWASTGSA